MGFVKLVLMFLWRNKVRGGSVLGVLLLGVDLNLFNWISDNATSARGKGNFEGLILLFFFKHIEAYLRV